MVQQRCQQGLLEKEAAGEVGEIFGALFRRTVSWSLWEKEDDGLTKLNPALGHD